MCVCYMWIVCHLISFYVQIWASIPRMGVCCVLDTGVCIQCHFKGDPGISSLSLILSLVPRCYVSYRGLSFALYSYAYFLPNTLMLPEVCSKMKLKDEFGVEKNFWNPGRLPSRICIFCARLEGHTYARILKLLEPNGFIF